MDQQPVTPGGVAPEPIPRGFDPRHLWAKPDARVNMLSVRPHVCMTNIKRRGSYIHCFNGNHGMRIPTHHRLVGYDKDGNEITSKNRKKAVTFDIVENVIVKNEKLLKPKKSAKFKGNAA